MTEVVFSVHHWFFYTVVEVYLNSSVAWFPYMIFFTFLWLKFGFVIRIKFIWRIFLVCVDKRQYLEYFKLEKVVSKYVLTTFYDQSWWINNFSFSMISIINESSILIIYSSMRSLIIFMKLTLSNSTVSTKALHKIKVQILKLILFKNLSWYKKKL